MPRQEDAENAARRGQIDAIKALCHAALQTRKAHTSILSPYPLKNGVLTVHADRERSDTEMAVFQSGTQYGLYRHEQPPSTK